MIPKCPQCGCRAAYVIMVAKVKCELDADGDLGRTVHVGQRKEDITGPVQYECHGGHRFVANPVS